MKLRSGTLVSSELGKTRSGRCFISLRSPKCVKQRRNVKQRTRVSLALAVRAVQPKNSILIFPFITSFPPPENGTHAEVFANGVSHSYDYHVFTGNRLTALPGGIWLHLQQRKTHNILCVSSACTLHDVMDCFLRACEHFGFTPSNKSHFCSLRGLPLSNHTSAQALRSMFPNVNAGSSPRESISLYMK
jgi:hypothetical protein